MRVKVTKKQILEDNFHVYGVGYCELQTLLRYEHSPFYSAGIYGWACDYYQVDDVIISTGYGYVGRKTDYKTVNKYEKLAQKIVYGDNDLTYEQKQRKVTRLFHKFIAEIKAVK